MIQPKDPEELRLLEEEPGLQPKVEQPQAPPPTPSFLQLPKELLSGVSHSALLKVGACVLLCLQNSSYTLLRRYSSGVLKERASSQSILAAGEAMKLGFSAIMVWRESGAPPKVRYLAATSAKMAIPALIFLLMNLFLAILLNNFSGVMEKALDDAREQVKEQAASLEQCEKRRQNAGPEERRRL